MQTIFNPQPRQRRWAARVRTGCTICRERRVKCDEHKPTCRRCLVAQRKCCGLGYGNEPLSESAALVSWRPSYSPRLSATSDVADIIYLAPLLVRQAARHNLDSRSVDCVSSFVASQGRELITYMHYLPSTCGHSELLDSAMHCVAEALRIQYTKASQRQEVPVLAHTVSLKRINSMRATYSGALQMLRLALNDQDLSVAPETLCATLLLYTFECVLAESGSASEQHAKGAVQLIQHRGAHRFNTEFEKALFASQLPIVAVDAYLNVRKSFLASSEWKQLFAEYVSALDEDKSVSASHMLYQMFSIPSFELFLEAKILITEGGSMSDFAAKRASMLRRFTSQREAVMDFARELDHRRPSKVLTSSRHDAGSLQHINDRLDHDRWFSLILSTKNVIMAQSRVLVALGVQDSQEMEGYAQSLAGEISKASGEHCKAAQWQPTTQVIVPCSNAVLKTAREWRALAAANDESDCPSTAPLDMWQRWLSLAAMGATSHSETNTSR